MLDTHGRKYADPVINAVAEIFIKMGFSANRVTVLSLAIGLFVLPFIYFDHLITATIILWISGLLDAVDGRIARKTGNTSSAGTLMDITFDRIVECSLVIILSLKVPESQFMMIILLSSIILSMTVFLTVGALSSKQGIKSFYYQAGVAERTEGFILFTFMILFPEYIHITAFIFTIMVVFTACQRFYEGIRVLK